jgi:signal transduction histidine kinase/tetratricopeptide (TPR) repeat protein
MARNPHWLRAGRRLLLPLVTIALGAAVALGWLGWHVLEQDRALESQRVQEQLDATADLIGAALVRKLAEKDSELTALLAAAPLDLAANDPLLARATITTPIVTFDEHRVDAYPRRALRYYPSVPPVADVARGVFERGEAFEFQQDDRAKAIDAFRTLVKSPDRTIKAEALLRLARNLRKTGQHGHALAAYDELTKVGPIPLAGLGVPAELVARHARCALFEETRDAPALEREARALYGDLQDGRWQLTHAAYTFYAADARRWLPPDPDLGAREENAVGLSAGIDWLWDEWQRARRGDAPEAGRRSLWVHDQPVLVLWRGTPERLVAIVAGRESLEADWRPALTPATARPASHVGLTDPEGHVVLGPAPASARPRHAVGRFSGLHVPWTVQVSSVDPAGSVSLLSGRRRWLFTGFAMTALLLAVGGYFSARAVSRELDVARVQSDFVAAVSHEFRTPLATMRQVSELLADGRVATDEHRRNYYEALRAESERLSRLVEDLLDFGRMDAGAREYRFQSVEPGALVRAVAGEFEKTVRAGGYRVEVAAAPSLPDVRGDREALGRALWNLLDNAVKYSRESKIRTVWVDAAREGHRVAIRVRDAGVGISRDDQRRIFNKFVRTSDAKAAGIRGTGLGLAMVQHIVSAHGGEVHVASQPGAGSAFTILLPVSP